MVNNAFNCAHSTGTTRYTNDILEGPEFYANTSQDVCFMEPNKVLRKIFFSLGKRSTGRETHKNVFRPLSDVQLNSVALVREQIMPTERPPLVGEVSANFCG
jgi:hypothetical protein